MKFERQIVTKDVYVYVYVLFDITIQNTLQITHNK